MIEYKNTQIQKRIEKTGRKRYKEGTEVRSKRKQIANHYI